VDQDARQKIVERGRQVLAVEIQGLQRVGQRLDDGFARAVELILAAKGKIVATGIGKSGIIARKIVATLNSTGANAIFLHPVEALHGDLGTVCPGDVVLALSNSGQTDELVNLTPQLRGHGAKIVALTGGMGSALARAADAVIDTGVEREACPFNLAPTASTTACMAVGDALAVVLMEIRAFKPEDFRRHHPGGNLGQRLALAVSEVMIPADKTPLAAPDDPVQKAVAVMDAGDLGSVLVTSGGRPGTELLGLFTDGDLRRAMVAGRDLGAGPIERFMTRRPLVIGPATMAADALHLMEERLITVLPVVDQGRLLGIVHLHDLLGRGSVSFRAITCPTQ